jgi:hemin uptake protein HemP
MNNSKTVRGRFTRPGAGKPPEPDRKEDAGRVSSAELLGDADRLIIEQKREEYVLRLTRSGKLI